jgi:FkbM family methyltransferase
MEGFYRQFLRPGSLCFDVGANVGNRTSVFLSIGAKVVAVEPQLELAAGLRRMFGSSDKVVIVESALGKEPGSTEMLVSSMDTLSSLSKNWVQRVKNSGRFGEAEWKKTVRVELTTLDSLISRHGLPEFCKIDVEGYELEVLAGLSKAIPSLSFEFTPEVIETAVGCITRLSEIGDYEFNFSIGESLDFLLADWILPDGMVEHLKRLPDKSVFGDVYARLRKQS